MTGDDRLLLAAAPGQTKVLAAKVRAFGSRRSPDRLGKDCLEPSAALGGFVLLASPGVLTVGGPPGIMSSRYSAK